MISSTDPGKKTLLIPSHLFPDSKKVAPLALTLLNQHVSWQFPKRVLACEVPATTDDWSTKSSLWPAFFFKLLANCFGLNKKTPKSPPKNTHTHTHSTPNTACQSKHNNRSLIYQTLFYTHHLHQKTSRWKREGTSIKAAGRVTIAPRIDNTVTATTTPPSWRKVDGWRDAMGWPLVLGR